MTATRRAVVFDLDGTLLDTSQLHSFCLRHACAAVGAPRPSAARLAAARRATDLATLAQLVGAAHAEEAMSAYHAALEQRVRQSRPAPMAGAATVLGQLRRSGYAIGVCTGRSHRGARLLLTAAGLTADVLVGRDDVTLPKPHPESLLTTIARLGVTTAHTLYVGDTATDAEQGRAAGVRTLLVGPPHSDAATRVLGSLTDLLTDGEVT